MHSSCTNICGADPLQTWLAIRQLKALCSAVFSVPPLTLVHFTAIMGHEVK